MTDPLPLTEPGTWAVVEASCVHSDIRRHWMRAPSGNWWGVGDPSVSAGEPDDWDSLRDPVVIRDGIT